MKNHSKNHKPIYSQKEEALADVMLAEISVQSDRLAEKKQQGIPEHKLTDDKKALVQNLRKLNNLLEKKPLDFVPVYVNSL